MITRAYRQKAALIVGGALAGAVIAGGLWKALLGGGTACRPGGDLRFAPALRETVGPDGLRRYVPDGCQIDGKGFHNVRVPESADVVALGDSNTWGTGRDTWPRALERSSGLTVYNISMPGWGPFDYLVAMPEGLALHPRMVVVALYQSNDIYDAYARVAARSPAMAQITEAFPLPPDLAQDWIWETVEDETKAAGIMAPQSWTRADYETLARKEPDRMVLLRVGPTDVYLTPRYRFYGVNLDEPRIAFGLETTKVVLEQMAQTARQANARLAVVLLPSKEYVYCDIAPEAQTSPTWSKLCVHEARIESELLRRLNDLGVAHMSALGSLRAAAAAGRELYQGVNTHPNEEALALFAECARSTIEGAGNTRITVGAGD